MILYTEKELKEAYKEHIKDLQDVPNVSFPTLEEFRIIFEDFWREVIEEESERQHSFEASKEEQQRGKNKMKKIVLAELRHKNRTNNSCLKEHFRRFEIVICFENWKKT